MSYEALILDFGILGEQFVEVQYYHQPYCSGSWDEPPTPEEWLIESVTVRLVDKDVEILPLLDDHDLDAIIEEIKKK